MDDAKVKALTIVAITFTGILFSSIGFPEPNVVLLAQSTTETLDPHRIVLKSPPCAGSDAVDGLRIENDNAKFQIREVVLNERFGEPQNFTMGRGIDSEIEIALNRPTCIDSIEILGSRRADQTRSLIRVWGIRN